jgi:integrase
MKKPFYREARKCWYVKDASGRFIRLDPDEEKAHDLWQRMRQLANFRSPDATLEAIFEAFLADLEHKVKKYRLDSHIYSLESFSLHYGPQRQARTVTAADILRWVRSERTIRGEPGHWSIARQRDAGQAVKRALAWAIRRSYLPWSDVMELEFETPRPRESTIDYATHCQLVLKTRELKRSRPFGLVLIALRLSGARPINVREVTAANFVNGAWVFKRHKTGRKTGKPLIVRCNGCLSTLTRILSHARTKGPLFLSWERTAWPKDGIVLRFKRLRESLKLDGISAYSYRHSFATDALESGASIATVAALLGHSDATMVARVYGHLDKRSHYLQDAVSQIHTSRMRETPKSE